MTFSDKDSGFLLVFGSCRGGGVDRVPRASAIRQRPAAPARSPAFLPSRLLTSGSAPMAISKRMVSASARVELTATKMAVRPGLSLCSVSGFHKTSRSSTSLAPDRAASIKALLPKSSRALTSAPALSNASATWPLPRKAAPINAVRPSLPRWLTLAPWRKRMSTMAVSSLLLSAASASGAAPRSGFTSTS